MFVYFWEDVGICDTLLYHTYENAPFRIIIVNDMENIMGTRGVRAGVQSAVDGPSMAALLASNL